MYFTNIRTKIGINISENNCVLYRLAIVTVINGSAEGVSPITEVTAISKVYTTFI